MAELFAVDVRTISEHLTNIFASSELGQDSIIRKFRITATDGKTYQTQHYNLDAIISVGYRVNSVRATQFCQWATSVLREFAVKGYALDKERLENGHFLGRDYFERLLEEILAHQGDVSGGAYEPCPRAIEDRTTRNVPVVPTLV
ncbi:MAG: virulence RhuM family protein [Propionibacteriaceae bacterium]|jgi:hypothetical protein|nr:virulence RhuM family protein [Propionibacteriaceae bacterium]